MYVLHGLQASSMSLWINDNETNSWIFCHLSALFKTGNDQEASSKSHDRYHWAKNLKDLHSLYAGLRSAALAYLERVHGYHFTEKPDWQIFLLHAAQQLLFTINLR